jgi:CRP-like cAMP-binding protein
MSYQARKALAEIDLFAALPDSMLEDLVQRGTTRTVGAGEVLVTQGTPDAGLQVVLEGSAEVTVNGRARPPLGPGEYFGEISMIDGAPRSATVVAGPNGLTTFMLSSLAFAPMATKPDVAQVLMKALCTRIRALEESLARDT